jgi:hypothetical protein
MYEYAHNKEDSLKTSDSLYTVCKQYTNVNNTCF